jgi:hypothetical protein
MSDWKQHGIRIVRSGELDLNTPQTPGMTRAAAINYARTGAQKLWAGTVVVQPNAKTGPHHHGELETVLYIVRGRARSAGETGWSSSTKPDRATSSTSRLTCRTRNSMPRLTNQSKLSL